MDIEQDQQRLETIASEICRIADERQRLRLMVAIAGGPAAGKSTLGAALVTAINQGPSSHKAIYVPMDGFHKTAIVLEAEGRTALKGKPETFAVDDFLAFLERVRQGEQGLQGPQYSRKVHDVVENAYTINGEDIAVVEGNYLLLDVPVWKDIQGLFDYKVFVEVSEQTSMDRLFQRHIAGGRSAEWTKAHMAKVDLPNFQLILPTRGHADLTISGELR